VTPVTIIALCYEKKRVMTDIEVLKNKIKRISEGLNRGVMFHIIFMTDNLINSKKNEFKHPRQSHEVSRQSTEGIVTHTKEMQYRGTTNRTYVLFIEGCSHLQQNMNKANTQYFLINLSWSKLQN
jgi:hypothetical protein